MVLDMTLHLNELRVAIFRDHPDSTSDARIAIEKYLAAAGRDRGRVLNELQAALCEIETPDQSRALETWFTADAYIALHRRTGLPRGAYQPAKLNRHIAVDDAEDLRSKEAGNEAARLDSLPGRNAKAEPLSLDRRSDIARRAAHARLAKPPK